MFVARMAGGGHDPVQLAEELSLDLEVLEGGLDHELARAQVGELGRQREPAECGIFLLLGQAPLFDAPGEVVVDRPARALAELLGDIAPDDLDAGLKADLRDPGTHGAEPDHADPGDLHGARSYALRAPSSRARVNLFPRGPSAPSPRF